MILPLLDVGVNFLFSPKKPALQRIVQTAILTIRAVTCVLSGNRLLVLAKSTKLSKIQGFVPKIRSVIQEASKFRAKRTIENATIVQFCLEIIARSVTLIGMLALDAFLGTTL